MHLNQQQDAALYKIKRWYEDGGQFSTPFRLFGYAGTGKTTLARYLDEALGVKAVFGTYTGKAASVLQRKGVNGQTIHSSIYHPMGTAETKARLAEAQAELEDMESDAASGDPIACGWASALELAGAMDQQREMIEGLEREANTIGFVLNPDSDWASADLIVLDEVSMVNAKIGADIESFGVPILVLGDPAQLPPVEGGGYYTDAAPDAMLTEVMRQAGESPVLDLATRIRQSSRRDFGLTEADIRMVNMDEAMTADQVLVWKNATRWNLVNAMRRRLGRPAGTPVVGDRVMCLTNNRELGVLNGQQFEVLEVRVDQWTSYPQLLLKGDDGRAPRWIDAYPDGFQGLTQEAHMKKNYGAHRGRMGAFTFANVITVHKAQGSEWPSVYVVDQTDGVVAMARKEGGAAHAIEMGRRWLYTATTRAQESVVIARK